MDLSGDMPVKYEGKRIRSLKQMSQAHGDVRVNKRKIMGERTPTQITQRRIDYAYHQH